MYCQLTVLFPPTFRSEEYNGWTATEESKGIAISKAVTQRIAVSYIFKFTQLLQFAPCLSYFALRI
jgi:hypothetical protein